MLSVQLCLLEILCLSYDVELRNVCRSGLGLSKPLIVLIEKYV